MVNEYAYVHGYHPRENMRLQDQASTLEEILHSDTHFPPGSRILEAGCGVGAQTVPLAKKQPAGNDHRRRYLRSLCRRGQEESGCGWPRKCAGFAG